MGRGGQLGQASLVKRVLSSPAGKDPGRPFGGLRTWRLGRTPGKRAKSGRRDGRGKGGQLIHAASPGKSTGLGPRTPDLRPSSATNQLERGASCFTSRGLSFSICPRGSCVSRSPWVLAVLPMSGTERSLCRENILVLDIFFEALNYETIEQKKAYEVAALLGKSSVYCTHFHILQEGRGKGDGRWAAAGR